MPHTNRKKKSSASTPATVKQAAPELVYTKRQQIVDDAGWTHVLNTPRKWQQNAKQGQFMLHAGGDFEKDGVSYIERTIAELKADWEYYLRRWESDGACAALREGLVEVGRGRVDGVVCLGLGSLQSSRREGRRASFTQLAALHTIVNALAVEQHLPCIFQDPQFTALDKEFLSSLGYTVVHHPAAFAHITERSLVYAIHCYAPVYKSIAEGPRPAAMIGTDVENFGRFSLSESTEGVARSLEEMVRGCETIDFPQVRNDFSDTKIYWRKVGESSTT